MQNILFADDEKDLWKLCRRTIENKGCIVSTANNGEEAIKLLENTVFDIAFTDLRMPGAIDGLELLKTIKSTYPKTEVIVVTAEGSLESAFECLNLGAFDYILKPFNLKELSIAINRITVYMNMTKRENIFKETNYISELYAKAKINTNKKDFFSYILEKSVRLLGADSGSIHYYQPDKKTLKLASYLATSRELDQDDDIKLGERMLGWVEDNLQPLLLKKGMDLASHPAFKDLIINENISSSIVVPLFKQNTFLGVACLNRFTKFTDKPFTNSDIDAMQYFASHLGIIMALTA